MDMDKYYPFNSVGNDRNHDASDMQLILRSLITDGVFMVSATALQGIAAGNFGITIKAGTGIARGCLGVNESDKSITTDAPFTGADRIDRIVMRANYASRKCELVYVPGTPASTPVAPALKNDADGFDVKLMAVRVNKTAAAITQADITDERTAANPVVPSNLDTLLAQLDTTFYDWFETLQAVLDSNTAANLLALITQHAPVTYTASVPTSGWSASAPYTQTVTVTGIASTDNPMVDVSLSATAATAMNQIEAYGNVGKIVTGTDQITLTCYEDKPAVDLTLQLKVVR